jgi:hypothetical protein
MHVKIYEGFHDLGKDTLGHLVHSRLQSRVNHFDPADGSGMFIRRRC